MAQGIFTLKNQLQALTQKAWYVAGQTIVPPFSTFCASFNNTTQYLTTNSITLSGDFTIEGWLFYIDSDTNNVFFAIGNYASGGLELWCNNQYYTMDGYGTGGYFFGNDGAPIPVRTWFHFAVVRSGSTVTAYINGVAGKSATNANSFTGAMYIGAAYNGSILNHWDGSISNIRVTNTAVYTSNFTVPSSPLTNISGTQLLTLQNATIIDNSSNGYTITNSGSVVTEAATLRNPITYLLSRSNPPPAVEYLLVAGGGGGGGANGGGGAGGLLTGVTPVTAGISHTITIGGGGNGGNGSSYTAGANGVNSVFGSITASGGGGGASVNGNGLPGGSGGGGGAPVNAPPSGVYATVGGQGIPGQGNFGGNGLFNANYYPGGGGGGAGTIGFTSSTNAVAGNGGAGIASSILGTVYTFAGGGGGGVLNSGTSGAGGVGGGGGGGALSGTVGAGGSGYNAGGAGTTGYGGSGGSGGARTGGGGGSGSYAGNNGGAGGGGIAIISYSDIYNPPTALTGNPYTTTSGSGSFYFDGTSNIITTGTGSFNPRNAFTIEFWINAPSYSTVTFINSNTGNDFYFETAGTTLYVGDGVQNTIALAATLPPLNTWTHVALSFDGTTYRLFYDGISQATSTSLLNSATLTAFRIGQKQDSTRTFKGLISNLRVLVGRALYTSAFTPPSAPLTAVANTSLLFNTVSGSFLADGSTNAYTSTITNNTAWNSASPFATGLGYKNRVYNYIFSGTITF